MAKSIIDRIALVFVAMVNALQGKVEDPQAMLEETYQELQDKLITTRKEFAAAVSEVRELKEQLRVAMEQGADVLALRSKLSEKAENAEKLRTLLEQLEEEVQKSYTKKQLNAARGAIRAASTNGEQGADDDLLKRYLQVSGVLVLVWISLSLLLGALT